MKLETVLKDHSFPQNAVEHILSLGIESFYPPQAEAITKGALNGNSLLMSVPTAAGKTLVAELCMVRSILLHQGRCLYIAPLKALASEKFNDFKKKYAPLGIEVGLAIGDHDSPTKTLNRYNIIVATAEKVDSLLRSQAKWLIDSLSVCVLDEIHFINDGKRGPTMEILIARIKQLNEKIQMIALSATVKNADEMAKWLKAELVKSTWRPIPLKEGVYYKDCIAFDKHGAKVITEDEPDDLSKLTADTLRGKGQVLIFVNSRRSAQAVSAQVSATVFKLLTSEEKSQLMLLSKKVVHEHDTTKIDRKLGDAIIHGAAFHHAGLRPAQRELIEENFKKNLIKVISCTPTLAAGVNLPARRAIIRDLKRFESGMGQAYIPTSEYKQCAGRAGRPQYDDYGEAVLVAKTLSETETLFERYIHAQPEPVMSKLAGESALRIHLLASIAGGYIFDTNGMFEFLSHTFLAHQKNTPHLLEMIGEIFDFLHREKFIEQSGSRYFATPLGNLTSRLYIDPVTAITLRDGLNKIKEGGSFTDIGALHLITSTPDSELLNVGKSDLDDTENFAGHFHDQFLLTPENYPVFDDLYAYLRSVRTTWLLAQWVEEEKEDLICEQFNVGPGDIYRHVEAAQWLLYAAGKTSSCAIRH
jgi:helicase